MFLCNLLLLRRYFTTAQLMVNGFLTAQGIPPHALFDPHRPSESLANLFDFIAREHLHTKISTIVYVKPAVTYVKDLVKLGKARGLLQKFNATELSDKLTDTVNLEVHLKRKANKQNEWMKNYFWLSNNLVKYRILSLEAIRTRKEIERERE